MATWTKPDFRGNPYATISAIDTSGGIATSRTSGTTPMFFHASASEITATGTSEPWSDLEYRWVLRHNDGSLIVHTDTLTDPSTGQEVDPLVDQFGPEAFFVLREAGTYRLRLYCRGKNGGSFTMATVDETITASAFSPTDTFYVDPDNGDDGNAGTEISPKETLASVLGGDRAIYLKAGSVTSVPTSLSVDKLSDFWITTYGGASRAILRATAEMGLMFSTHASNSSGTGIWGSWTISNIDFDCNNMASRDVGGTHSSEVVTSAYLHTYFDNCVMRDAAQQMEGEAEDPTIPTVIQKAPPPGEDNAGITGLGFWKCQLLAQAPGVTCLSRMFTNLKDPWRSYLGTTFVVGQIENTIRDHHIYDSGYGGHRIFRWNTFGAAGGTSNCSYCINLNCGGLGEVDTDYVYIGGNLGQDADWFSDASNTSNLSDGTFGEFTSVIWEENALTDLESGVWYMFSLTGIGVIRNNVVYVDETSNSTIVLAKSGAGADHPGSLSVYGNNWYVGTSGNPLVLLPATHSGNSLYRDNKIEAEVTSSTVPINVPWALTGGQTRDWDDNEYRLSGAAVINDQDGIQTETFANWQDEGYDTSSTLTTDGTEVGWPDPANGGFAAANTPIPAALDGFGSVRTPVPSSLRLGSSLLLLGL